MRIFTRALPVALFLAISVSAEIADENDENFDPPPRNKPAVITVITDPPNSEVFLNGEDLGKSPVNKKNVFSGAYQKLIVIDQGKELINLKVHIWPGDDKRNVFKDLKTVMPAGTIRVTTNPGKCRIYLNGEDADRTDGDILTLNNVDAGDHVVRAECGGRLNAELLVNVKGEETTEVYLDAKSPKKSKAVHKGRDKKAEEE